ncbi:MAG: 4-alpha-glucanotransferase [Proteobacteria bacterium]|nr:4-alpha-glucanotransferase [Pseudomonadota bacterium]
MIKKRSSGMLAHITSLPSPFGIGDIGPSSYAFIDFLVDCEQSYWQFLPTGPTNGVFDNSPYMSTSAFAGTPLLISPELLLQDGLISQSDLNNKPVFSQYSTEYGEVLRYKDTLLHKAFKQFEPDTCSEYATFVETATWLDEYATFMTLKELCGDTGWFDWPEEFATRKPESLQSILTKHIEKINYFRFEQFEFFRQWRLLRQYASKQHISLIGDLPIYVSYDSVDVWAHQSIFSLDRTTLRPMKVSGVPPDYFSKTGQRWGNPLYDWHNCDASVQNELLNWWSARLSNLFDLVDMTRIDHFRGFVSYWAIPEENDTAIEGEWEKGPGADFFEKIYKKLGKLNIVAEDLGIITPEVEELRDKLGFPGMKVLQFAFDGNRDNSFLPCNYQSPQCIVYTGTHDNDTTVGWYLSEKMDDNNRSLIKKMANRSLHDQNNIHHDLIYLAQSSIAMLCIFPLQDVLGFGSDCKMNSPGVPEGNWRWRCAKEFLTPDVANYMKNSTSIFGRGRPLKEVQPPG